MTSISSDIIIIGAGIAGLWLHHRLNDLGYHAILIERQGIGGGQTLSSQGIIHGGAKYTLNGILSNAASAIADMPKRWLDCLEGNGEIDLSHTKLLSQHQLMWSTQSLSSKLTSFLSSKALNGKIQPLKKEQYPNFFQQKEFKGNLYQLNEPVLDVPSLVKNLSTKWQHRILCTADNYHFNYDDTGNVKTLTIAKQCEIHAKEFILTSGEGTEGLLKDLSIGTPRMQRRPLQMVLAKGENLPALYAHCVGASTKPIATISTHTHSDGDKIWYIGGNIAEDGANRNSEDLIRHTINVFNKILPWVDLSHVDWTTHNVNRAEPAQKDLLRPDTAFLAHHNNLHIGWPTKLALTPDLSDKLINALAKRNISKGNLITQSNNDQHLSNLGGYFKATLSSTLWERSFNAND